MWCEMSDKYLTLDILCLVFYQYCYSLVTKDMI